MKINKEKFIDGVGTFCYAVMMFLAILHQAFGKPLEAIYFLLWAIFAFGCKIYFAERRHLISKIYLLDKGKSEKQEDEKDTEDIN